MRKAAKRCLLLLLPALLLFSCKVKQEAAFAASALPPLTAQEVLQRSAINRNYGEITSKVDITYINGAQKQSVGARIRMKQDSVIWVSIAPLLGIELVRAKITPDSLMLVDRINKRFYLGSFDRVNEMLKVDLTFEMLQALLTGNAIELYDAERYRSQPDSMRYLIDVPELSKKDLKKGVDPPSIAQQTWIEPEHFSVLRSLFSDASRDMRMEANYGDLRSLGPVHFPESMAFDITGKQPMHVDIKWSKPTIAPAQDYPFSVPENYEPIK
jgi:hypothetical protein